MAESLTAAALCRGRRVRDRRKATSGSKKGESDQVPHDRRQSARSGPHSIARSGSSSLSRQVSYLTRSSPAAFLRRPLPPRSSSPRLLPSSLPRDVLSLFSARASLPACRCGALRHWERLARAAWRLHSTNTARAVIFRVSALLEPCLSSAHLT